MVEFSGDQHGSRFLQQKLESASIEERQNIFNEIVPNNVLHLIMDVFGNYVSSLFYVCCGVIYLFHPLGYTETLRVRHSITENDVDQYNGGTSSLSFFTDVWL